MSVEEEVKMVLFARWMATLYSSETLNNQDSFWYRTQVRQFNETVYPNYIKNGSVEEHIKGFTDSDTIEGVITDLP